MGTWVIKSIGKGSKDWRLAMITALLFVACGSDDTPVTEVPDVVLPELPATPLFDADSAYAYIAEQVAFGPRVPGTEAHRQCGDRLVERLKRSGAEVIEQTGTVVSFNKERLPLRNIIAQFHPERTERVLLFAHWDTRPFADKDEERTNEPIDGANDGGSGVGVLLEIARHLAAKKHGPGVDILLTDVEDHGQPSGAMAFDENSIDTWCLGSRYFVKNPHVPNYTARFGILLDMVGARDAKFYQEALSMQFAPAVVRKVWKTASAIGHGDRFVQETKYFVGIDDHVPVNTVLRIPSIDIIQYDPATQAFGPYWHTHDDNMDVIDPATLKAVGQTVLEVVWKER
ncbi:MAG: M28 family peptidase [Flavobacteriales bacterium]|nr:M28 family peptidase [Flavobacteriales bacterium]